MVESNSAAMRHVLGETCIHAGYSFRSLVEPSVLLQGKESWPHLLDI